MKRYFKFYISFFFEYNLFEYMVEQSERCDFRLERQSRKQEVVSSSPAVGDTFSFCNSCFHRADRSNQQVQMKSTVT